MKKNWLLFLLLCSIALSAQYSEDDVLGKWIAEDRSVAVEVFKVNQNFRAKVVWFDDRLGSGIPMHERKDTDNPNPKLRHRKIIGMEILEGLKYKPGSQSWENGKIYDATSGRYWDSSARITKTGLLKVRGYWKFKWIGKTMTFIKINESAFTKK